MSTYHIGETSVCGQPSLHFDITAVLIDLKQAFSCAISHDREGQLVEWRLATHRNMSLNSNHSVLLYNSNHTNSPELYGTLQQ